MTNGLKDAIKIDFYFKLIFPIDKILLLHHKIILHHEDAKMA